jgi:4-hydroxy-4-methyl-2-oxoglutarate aldolase
VVSVAGPCDTRKLERLAEATTALVADALDQLGLREQALDPAIRPVYAGARLVGRAVPIVVAALDEPAEPADPYANQIHAVESLGPGTVPVFACDPRSRAAAWGELFSCAARGRGALGAIMDGYVRDALQIAELAFPTFARGWSPLDTQGRAEVVEFGVEAVCGGVRIAPGDFVLADEDGVVAVPASALDDVLGYSGGKIRSEQSARAELLAGVSIRAVWEKYGTL